MTELWTGKNFTGGVLKLDPGTAHRNPLTVHSVKVPSGVRLVLYSRDIPYVLDGPKYISSLACQQIPIAVEAYRVEQLQRDGDLPLSRQPAAQLFDGHNYQGRYVTLMDPQSRSTLRGTRLHRKSLGSVVVADGYRLTVFSEPNYKGTKSVLEGSQPQLNLTVQSLTLDRTVEWMVPELRPAAAVIPPPPVTQTQLADAGALLGSSSGFPWWGWVLIVLAIILVIVIIVYFVVRSKNKKKREAAQKAAVWTAMAPTTL